jgi:hypothetical protein
MQAIMMAIVLPLMILNMLSGIVGGVWLGIRGEWGLIVGGLVYMFGSALALSVVLLPSMIFAAPAMALLERGRVIAAAIVSFPGTVWTHAVLGASCVAVFYFATLNPDSGSIWPYLLYGHAVAMAPWAYLAHKDEQAGNDSGNLPLFFAGLGVVSMMVGVLINGAPLGIYNLAIWFAPFTILGLLLHTLSLIVEAEAARRDPFRMRY